METLNKPILSVTMGAPQPSVFEATYGRPSRRAHILDSHDCPLRQVKVLLELTPGVTASLVRISATNEISGHVAYDKMEAARDSTGATLGHVSVSVSRKFTFKTNQP